MENQYYWIWLSIFNLSQIQKNKLLRFFKSPKKLFETSKKELKKLTTSKELLKIITNDETKKQAEEIYKNTIKENIKIITKENINYPKRLENLIDYPIVIYAKGNTNLLNAEKTISIIGTRNCSEYGRKITLQYSYFLARKNITIISGLAKGIDTLAHKGSLIAKGKTIAVLGSGINYIYPKENEKIYNDIIKMNGLIISEYPLITKPKPEYFPIRNRIISGLSDKILITEAGIKSGSIITAEIGLEQGKEIYAIPGNVTSTKSEGTNKLIKDGAFLVTNIEDIIDL